MKKLAILTIVLFVLVFCLTAPASAGPTIDQILSKKELVVGTSATYPPLTFKTKGGVVSGFDMDLARAIAASMDVRLRVEVIPFDELIPALEKGRIDMIISSMTITAERNLRIAFVGPYFISGQSILTTKTAAMDISSPADVNKAGFSIAVPRGTTTEMIAKNMLPKADRIPAASTDEALKMLVDGKVKAMMADFPYVTVEAIRYRDKGLVSNQPFTSEPLGIAVRPNDPLLVNFLENLLGTMRGNGLLNALTQRWFKEADWMADLP